MDASDCADVCKGGAGKDTFLVLRQPTSMTTPIKQVAPVLSTLDHISLFLRFQQSQGRVRFADIRIVRGVKPVAIPVAKPDYRTRSNPSILT